MLVLNEHNCWFQTIMKLVISRRSIGALADFGPSLCTQVKRCISTSLDREVPYADAGCGYFFAYQSLLM